MVWHKGGSTQISGRLRRNSWCATLSRCGFVRACHCCTFAQTQCVRLFCVGCGCAAAGALTTVSLFLKCKAADVSRGSDRGEWNVGAIFELNTHAQTEPPGSSVNSCCRFLHLLHHTSSQMKSLQTNLTGTKHCRSFHPPQLSLSLWSRLWRAQDSEAIVHMFIGPPSRPHIELACSVYGKGNVMFSCVFVPVYPYCKSCYFSLKTSDLFH